MALSNLKRGIASLFVALCLVTALTMLLTHHAASSVDASHSEKSCSLCLAHQFFGAANVATKVTVEPFLFQQAEPPHIPLVSALLNRLLSQQTHSRAPPLSSF